MRQPRTTILSSTMLWSRLHASQLEDGQCNDRGDWYALLSAHRPQLCYGPLRSNEYSSGEVALVNTMASGQHTKQQTLSTSQAEYAVMSGHYIPRCCERG